MLFPEKFIFVNRSGKNGFEVMRACRFYKIMKASDHKSIKFVL